MPADFNFMLDFGAASTQPARGTTRVTGITQLNLKNADDNNSTVYSDQPITAGNNSYEKFVFCLWELKYCKCCNISRDFSWEYRCCDRWNSKYIPKQKG